MPDDNPERPSASERPAWLRPGLRPSGLFRNWISWGGSAIALLSLANILFLLLLDVFGVRTNPYVGILAYMVLPPCSSSGWRSSRQGCSGNAAAAASWPRGSTRTIPAST